MGQFIIQAERAVLAAILATLCLAAAGGAQAQTGPFESPSLVGTGWDKSTSDFNGTKGIMMAFRQNGEFVIVKYEIPTGGQMRILQKVTGTYTQENGAAVVRVGDTVYRLSYESLQSGGWKRLV